MALLDTILRNTAAETSPLKPGVTTNTEAARRLAAARSGKASTTPGPMVDTSAEQASIASTNAGLSELAQKNQVSAAGIQQQAQQVEQEAGEKRQDIQLRQQAVQQQAVIRKNQILQSLQQGRTQLSVDQERAQAEDLAQALRLEDRKYMDKLELQGERQRLRSKLGFRAALQEAIFADNISVLQQVLGQNEILGMDRREYEKKISEMSLDQALAMSQATAAAEKQMGMIQGGTDLVKTGASAYGQYDQNQKSLAAQKRRDDRDAYNDWKASGGTGSFQEFQSMNNKV